MRGRTAISCIAIFLGFATALLQPQGDESDTRSRILALEHVWNQAEAFKDLKALTTLFDNALVYVDFEGTLMTKSEFLARVKSQHVQQVITQSINVRIFGTTAIVTGTYRSTELKHGKPLIRQGRFLDTWVYKNSNWTCIAAAASPLAR